MRKMVGNPRVAKRGERGVIALAIAVFALGCGDGKAGGQVEASETFEEVVDETALEPDTSVAPETAVEETSPEVIVPAARLETIFDEQTFLGFGLSKTLEVEIPADVVSITISVLGDESTYYGLADWVGPNSVALVTPNWMQTDEGGGGMCTSCNNRIALSAGAFATIAPNNPAATVEAGTHAFTLFGIETNGQTQAPANGPVRVIVHAKMAPGGELPATGTLDLNLHFTGAQGLTAQSAPYDGEFQATLESMRSIYRQVGIELGMITYRDIDAGYRSIESLDGEGSDLQAMFSESDGNTEAINLFFVNELSVGQFGSYNIILGIAGGIPGPVAQGSWRSGVAIAIKPIQGVPAGVDTTMAHEVGHFLGLFHTSEQAYYFGPQLHDPLPDTPQNDASYLMFNTGSGNVLSDWQGRVMRANPWVRHGQ